jgi:hypothetical protein
VRFSSNRIPCAASTTMPNCYCPSTARSPRLLNGLYSLALDTKRKSLARSFFVPQGCLLHKRCPAQNCCTVNAPISCLTGSGAADEQARSLLPRCKMTSSTLNPQNRACLALPCPFTRNRSQEIVRSNFTFSAFA